MNCHTRQKWHCLPNKGRMEGVNLMIIMHNNKFQCWKNIALTWSRRNKAPEAGHPLRVPYRMEPSRWHPKGTRWGSNGRIVKPWKTSITCFMRACCSLAVPKCCAWRSPNVHRAPTTFSGISQSSTWPTSIFCSRHCATTVASTFPAAMTICASSSPWQSLQMIWANTQSATLITRQEVQSCIQMLQIKVLRIKSEFVTTAGNENNKHHNNCKMHLYR